MKNLINVCLLLLILILGAVPFSAIAASNVGGWNEVLEQNNLSEIAKTIHNGKKIKWPKILSPQAAENLPEDERQSQADVLKLAERLFEKIKEYEGGLDKTKDDNLRSVITTYSNLSKGLRLSGGFVNLVLADSVNRLALSHIAVFLVRNQDAYQEGKELLDETGLPAFSMEEFVRVFSEEAVILEKEIKLLQMQKLDSLSAVLDVFGVGFWEVAGAWVDKGKTSSLLQQQNFPVFLWRLCETDTFAQVHLYGLVEFLKRGGTYDMLDLKDVTKYSKIMGGNEHNFRFDFMGIGRVGADNLKIMIDELKNLNYTPPFYVIAIE